MNSHEHNSLRSDTTAYECLRLSVNLALVNSSFLVARYEKKLMRHLEIINYIFSEIFMNFVNEISDLLHFQ